ncbi:hypothetical protein FRC14_006181 [Serendipita sp. 396]|nr:hypothetical protein FRC14_006181 [Serendipita sp. 396]KAG8790833.1 hypothetical protein FRC16_000698 [Serendipita sp. 398]KAG9052925.1 hypothetical protein FS842_009036 [Serendipita sp. 407]
MTSVECMNATKFDLVPDPRGGAMAIAPRTGRIIQPGEVLLRTAALTTSLVPKWKGKRCDWCCRRREELKACSRCKNTFYCDSDCQAISWKSHHRKLCGILAKGFHFSASYLGQSTEQKTNSDLLLNLYGSLLLHDEGRLSGKASESQRGILDVELLQENALMCFWALGPLQLGQSRPSPALPKGLPSGHLATLNAAWSRFDNNNFVLHNISSLEPEAGAYAHGIFPLASRCFNHSCVPNAWPAFMLQDKTAWIEIRALDFIKEGQEITIPYLDPALPLIERRNRLQQAYGFICDCPRCMIEGRMAHPSDPVPNESLLQEELISYALPQLRIHDLRTTLELLKSLPRHLWSIRNPDFIKHLTETFENQSHDGPYEDAWRSGKALLALCLILYPRYHPLTGYYALELGKACWNAQVAENTESHWLQRLASILDFAESSLQVAGAEEEDEIASGILTVQKIRSLMESKYI